MAGTKEETSKKTHLATSTSLLASLVNVLMRSVNEVTSLRAQYMATSSIVCRKHLDWNRKRCYREVLSSRVDFPFATRWRLWRRWSRGVLIVVVLLKVRDRAINQIAEIGRMSRAIVRVFFDSNISGKPI